jgi:hypothetical protein
MRKALLSLALWSGAALAQPAAAPPAMPPDGPDAKVDYADAANWLCRPDWGSDSCAADLGAMAYDAAGQRTPKPFAPAAAPPIDCFYVYPTVSNDPTAFSDLNAGAGEEVRATVAQAARFRSVCRLFVPTYRQLTLTALRAATRGAALPGGGLDHGRNYDDVKAAWASYLARDNKGRGVVLIGHSQGAILLKRLIAEEIDGKPAQKLLVSAILAGNPDLTVATGSDRGGSFRTVPACRTADQAGCVVGWSSYAADDASPVRAFGGNGPVAGRTAICVNPAAPSGGKAPLDGYVPRPAFAPVSDPLFVEQVGQLTGECVTDGQGSVLRIDVAEGPLAPLLKAGLSKAPIPGWGLHTADLSLPQGDLLRLVERQGKVWAAGK